MDIYEMIELQDCPYCDGPSILEEVEGGFYVTCLDCGCLTGTINYKNEDERILAAKKAGALWNAGKVLYVGRSE